MCEDCSPRIQTLMSIESSQDGALIGISFNTDDISFELLDMTIPEVEALIEDLFDQLGLMKSAYVRLGHDLTQIRKPE